MRVKQAVCLQEQNGFGNLPAIIDHRRRVVDNILDNRVCTHAEYMEKQRRKKRELNSTEEKINCRRKIMKIPWEMSWKLYRSIV